MASSSSSLKSNNTFVILELKDPLSTETDLYTHKEKKNEIFISNENISHFYLPSVHLTSHTIKVQANRNKLIDESSYFRSLLTGNFSESFLDSVSVQWNLEIVMDVLKFIHGFCLNISINNFIPLMEGARFFGVETILSECLAWFSEATSTREKFTKQIPLESIVELWSFGLEHAIGWIPEQCTGYLARNFMAAISCGSFLEFPYKLIRCCIEHPHLTIDSEKHLAEALLDWLETKTRSLDGSSVCVEDNYSDILKVVRVTLLPFWFAAGKKKSCYFSEFADKSISAILDLMNNPSTSLRRVLSGGDHDSITIRLTKYTERIDLSGCPQITSALLFLSLLPCSHKMDVMSQERIEKSLTEIANLHMCNYGVPQNMFPTLFEAVYELDVSKCPHLHFEAVIKWFCKSFPSLKIFKASHYSHFKMTTLFNLVQSFSLLDELYFNADISPVISTQVTIVSTCIDGYRDLDVPSYRVLKERPLAANISKLILEGRTEIDDLDLNYITLIFGSLCYLNLRGCTSVTDIGISKLISKCLNLHSIVACDTNFGNSSILALCSDLPSLECFHGVNSTSLASRLQKLHIGGCKSIDATSLLRLMSHILIVKRLCLRGTFLDDNVTSSFMGSSLERLDVSETLVSGVALARIIRRNPGIKCIKLRDSKNLCHLGGSTLAYGSKGENVYVEIGRTCKLEDVEFGWGFSSLSLDNLGPALTSLRHVSVGLGASLSHHTLMLLPTVCPLLESVILTFQVISDCIVKTIVESLRQLRVLGLCYCLGDLSPMGVHISMPNLRKLRLERVIPWMTNDDLVILTQNCTSLIELSLSGCRQLISESQRTISCGWPGLISLRLEDCGEVTSNGISHLFDCKAIEDLLLRHSGCGIQRNFIAAATAKMPMLRKVALDLCDACEGGFESPSYADRCFLSTVTIARCKQQKCAFELQTLEGCRRPVHKESIVMEWNSRGIRTTVVKERL